MNPLDRLKALTTNKTTPPKLPDKITPAPIAVVVAEAKVELIPTVALDVVVVDMDKATEVGEKAEVDERLTPILNIMHTLEQRLQLENPQIEEYMVMVNQNLRQFPDLIHLLSDEQIAPFYKAMLKQADIKLAPKKATAKKAAAKAEVIDLTVDIFGLRGLDL